MKHPQITLFGIAHCDTVRKARAWLASQGLAYTFHDYGKQGLPAEALALWLDAVGWETLLNRRGTTWRQLSAAQQAQVQDAASAAALMRAHTSCIKRPVVQWQGAGGLHVTVGFDAAHWAQLRQSV